MKNAAILSAFFYAEAVSIPEIADRAIGILRNDGGRQQTRAGSDKMGG